MERTAEVEHAINFGRKDACLYPAEVPPSVPYDYETGATFYCLPAEGTLASLKWTNHTFGNPASIKITLLHLHLF